MQKKKTLNPIFTQSSDLDFAQLSIETFRYQYQNIEVYHKFVDYLKIDVSQISKIEEIPFLPIEMFKSQLVFDRQFQPEVFFQSSGTTNIQTLSKHYIADFSLYEQSIYQSFCRFIGRPEDYIFLGLLPSYLERENSSLIYMVNYLMKISGKPENGFFLYNHSDLFELLKKLQGQKVILFGVSFAILDFLDYCKKEHPSYEFQMGPDFMVIETGGMKGRKVEMTKDVLLGLFQKGFRTDKIYSEYSMTELLSQAYSLGSNRYETPDWMRILIRNTEDPFSYMPVGRTGAVNIIDLANRHSCSFIATQDLGRRISEKNSQFEILGRIDHSDIRGCSLLVS